MQNACWSPSPWTFSRENGLYEEERWHSPQLRIMYAPLRNSPSTLEILTLVFDMIPLANASGLIIVQASTTSMLCSQNGEKANVKPYLSHHRSSNVSSVEQPRLQYPTPSQPSRQFVMASSSAHTRVLAVANTVVENSKLAHNSVLSL